MNSTRKQAIWRAALRAASSALLVVGYAGASPSYAPRLAAALRLEAEPPCTLCHRTNDGGDGTVDRPFGRSVLEYGALGNNDLGSLDAALKVMHAESADSDGDAVADLVELQRGEDPNVPRPRPPEPPGSGGHGGGEHGSGAQGSGAQGDAGAPGASSEGDSVGSPHVGAASTTAQSAQPSPPVLRTGCAVSGRARQPSAAWLLALAGVWQFRRLRRVRRHTPLSSSFGQESAQRLLQPQSGRFGIEAPCCGFTRWVHSRW